MLKKILIAVLGACMAAVCGGVHAAGEAYPSRAIRVVVPFSPGGSTDVLARPITAKLSSILGVPVIVDNRGGAGGNIGASLVAKAPADGYTLMLTTSGVIVANKSLHKHLAFDPEKDFVPITRIASLPNVLTVSAKSPYRTVRDIIAAARKEPGKLTFASGGVGTSNHLAGELFKSLAGINILHVPYRGGGPAVLAVLSDEVTMLFATMPSAVSQIAGGKLRALAVTSPARAAALPEVPTMIEAGVQDFDVSIWIGALAPAGTPPAVVETLNKAFRQVLQDQDVLKGLHAEGFEEVGDSPQQMAQTIAAESASWARVIRGAGIEPQ